MNPQEIHVRPTGFLRFSYQQKYCQLRLKGTERIENERRPLDPQNFTGKKQADKTHGLQSAIFMKRKDDRGIRHKPRGQTHQPREQN